MQRLITVLAAVTFSVFTLAAQDAADVLTLEAKLAVEPGSEETRAALMDAYAKARDPLAYVQQVLWLVHNKPSSQILAAKGKLKPEGGPLNSATDYQQVNTEWDVQLEQQPKSAPINYNAAAFLTASDPTRAIDLLEQAREIAPGHPEYAAAEGSAYLMAFRRDPSLTEDVANALKARLQSSADPELLGEAGKVMATEAHEPELKKIGLSFMQRAVSLETDPQIARRRRATLESMDDSLTERNMKRSAMQVDSTVAVANLVEKVEPAYPALAKSGRVQGVVELTILIGPDGTVQTADLVSGPALLVSAAKDAVLQWKYNMKLLNGIPVPVVTNVSVTFSLSQ